MKSLVFLFVVLSFSALGYAQPKRVVSAQTSENSGPSIIALVSSGVIPGTGEIYLKEKHIGQWFLFTDIALWTGFFFLQGQINQLTSSASHMGETYAGSRPSSDLDYLETVANYTSYNGVSGRTNPVFGENYLLDKQRLGQEALYGDEDAWSWGDISNPQNRKQQQKMKDQLSWIRVGKITSNVTLGLLVLNRVLSVADVWRVGKKARGQIKIIPQSSSSSHSPDGFSLAIDF